MSSADYGIHWRAHDECTNPRIHFDGECHTTYYPEEETENA